MELNILQQYQEKVDFTHARKAANRGRPAGKAEISEAARYYLEGDSVAEIAKSLYRSPSFVRAIIEKLGVPTRRKKDDRGDGKVHPRVRRCKVWPNRLPQILNRRGESTSSCLACRSRSVLRAPRLRKLLARKRLSRTNGRRLRKICQTSTIKVRATELRLMRA